MRKKLIFLFLIVVNNNCYSQKSWFQKHIQYLSSDSLEGRFVESNGAFLAANYISNYFAEIHLAFGNKDSYIQKFNYTYKLNPHSNIDRIDSTIIKGENVIGFLNNNANKTIVIGAHYDHIGKNEHLNSTLSNSIGKIHNGADDNASGVAIVLELANELTNNNIIENVNYLFICFSGEEDGLIGSKYFVENYNNTELHLSAMLNYDMIGRLDSNNTLQAGGVGSSTLFGELILSDSFTIKTDSSGIGPSDHTSFYLKNIPVLFFSTGSHSDYHKPTDDEEKINYDGLEKIYNYSLNIIQKLSESDTINFIKTKNRNARQSTKFKVTLGILPNYNAAVDGVLIDAVIDNKAAFIAGMESGDIIQQIGKSKVNDIYSYMDCLSKYEKGATVKVVILRKSKVIIKKVTF